MNDWAESYLYYWHFFKFNFSLLFVSSKNISSMPLLSFAEVWKCFAPTVLAYLEKRTTNWHYVLTSLSKSMVSKTRSSIISFLHLHTLTKYKSKKFENQTVIWLKPLNLHCTLNYSIYVQTCVHIFLTVHVAGLHSRKFFHGKGPL